MFRSWGWWTRAAIFHDVLYHYGAGQKRDADKLFYSILLIDQPVPPEEGHEDDAFAMYQGVKFFGSGNFDDPIKSPQILSNTDYIYD